MSRDAKYSSYKNLGANQEQTKDPSENTPECFSIINAEHKNKLFESNRLVVIKIYGTWCGPCKIVAPKFYELAKKYNNLGKCMLVKENVDDDLSEGIQGVPAFDFFFEGKLVDRITGADINAVEAKIMELLSKM